MRLAIGISAALLIAILVLTKLQSAHPGLAPADQLAFERQRADRLRTMLQGNETVPADLTCPAATVSDATIQTLYVVWLNSRPDLTTVQDRDAAAADLDHAIITCREDPASLEMEAHARGMDLQKSVALAILKAGR
jgi:hypothetical protein